MARSSTFALVFSPSVHEPAPPSVTGWFALACVSIARTTCVSRGSGWLGFAAPAFTVNVVVPPRTKGRPGCVTTMSAIDVAP